MGFQLKDGPLDVLGFIVSRFNTGPNTMLLKSFLSVKSSTLNRQSSIFHCPSNILVKYWQKKARKYLVIESNNDW